MTQQRCALLGCCVQPTVQNELWEGLHTSAGAASSQQHAEAPRNPGDQRGGAVLHQPHSSTSDEAELRCWNRAVRPSQASQNTSRREKVQFNIHKSPFGRAAPPSISSIPSHHHHCPQPTSSLQAPLCCSTAIGTLSGCHGAAQGAQSPTSLRPMEPPLCLPAAFSPFPCLSTSVF